MNKLRDMILSNPWTTLIAVAAIAALAIHSGEVTPAQVTNFVLTALLGLSSKDGGKGESK